HAASTLFLLLAAWLMVGEGGRRIRPLVWIAIGVCVGLAFGIRPLTGLAMTASLAGWYLLRSRPSLARAAGAAAWTALGAAGPTAAVLYYNTVTTGDPLQFGYVAANGALHHLGFGLRGFLVYNQAGLPRPDAHAFSAALALRHVGDNLWGLLLEFLPSALLAPLLIVAARQRFHWPWATMALFALVPLAYAFWFYNRMQYSVDLFPYAFIGIAILLEYLRERQPALVRSTALYLVVVLPVAPLAHLIRDREVHRPCRESYQAVGAMRRREQLLLFVEQRPTSQEMLLECLSVFNTHGFSGDVVVARDLGASDSLLMSRLPGHTPWRVGWDDSRQRARIERFR
ncbi:MAG TPA: hypothetical protein VFU23_06605, partial [Gemmatimonadales bacterium]|nr:hypothetical protein [Gemmatimonadales bacterium]